MKILTVCPTIRPELFESMQDSFYRTSSDGNVLYPRTTGTVTEAINYVFNKYPNFDFYHIGNDDCEYLTPQWDVILAKKGKITYGEDGIQNQNLCTFPMIDGDIVRALGWLQLPTLTRYSGDQVWHIIGKILGILEYHPEVVIKHNWQGWDEKLGFEDLHKANEWANGHMKEDIEKVRKVICQK